MPAHNDRYSAFVSYRHMPRDRQWALRIMSELEAYRTPKALQSEAFPDRIGHLFRDEDEIPASTDLSDQIKDALGKSDYLIVICSPDTPASRWVRREIELFQEMGKSERIIPLLIAGEPEESFPPELRRRRVVVPRDDGRTDFIWEEVEPVAADVRPRKDESRAKTERRALMRLAAALLGCRFDDLARRDEERRKKQLQQQLGTGAALLTIAALGGLWWWDANLRVHTQYCAAYGERWAAPFCVGELGAAEQRARKTSYRIKTRAGLVREMARVNGSGALADKQNSEYEEKLLTAGVALWRFAYGSDARSSEPHLASAVLENKTGKQLRQIGYEFSQDRQQAIARFNRDFDVTERQSAEGSALDLNASGSNMIPRHSSIGQHRLFFDARGLIQRREFEPVGGGASVADSLGSHGRTYEYGVGDLPKVIRNLDALGGPLVEKTGVAGQRHSYDARGNLTSVEWIDVKGGLRANEQFFAKALLVYDANGNIEQEHYLGETGAPTIRRGGFASLSQKYDEHGNVIELAYFGADGKLTLYDKDVASVTFRYDERGNKVEEAYFGIDGKPTLSKVGVAYLVRHFDERGNIAEEAYFGIDGKPVLTKDGIARAAQRYDEQGNLVEVAYFGPDGKPVLNEDGSARWTRAYDKRGNMVEVAYFGLDGKPARSGEGYARQTMRYDERGNQIEKAYFGVDGKPAQSRDDGIARETSSYDERGNEVEWAYFGVDGKPVLSNYGYARATERYDERGNAAERAFFGLDGKPTLSGDFFARATVRYDERGNAAEVAYFGVDGKPMLIKDGIARLTTSYDERGNVVEEAYFGVDGKPALRKDGIARVTERFDDRGNVVEQAFFGLDGKRTLNKSGFARATVRYDERGNEVEKAYFGVDGKLLSDADMKPKPIVEKDASGRIVSAMLRDAEGRAILVDDIGVKAKYSYADGDKPIAVTYLDEHEKIIPVEVEVNGIVADSTAARIGLAPGDRLRSYAGEKLRSTQQLIALVGKPGDGARKLVYQRAGKTITVEVPPGRIGVSIQNVRATPAPAAPPKPR